MRRPRVWRPRLGGSAAVYRAAWTAVAGLVGAVGVAGGCVVLGPFASVCLVAVGGVLGAATVPWGAGTAARAGRSPVVAGVLGAVLPLAVLGLLFEVGAGGLVLCVLVAAGWWPLRRRAGRTAAAAPVVGEPPPLPETIPPDPLPAPDAVAGLGTPELCLLWRVTYGRLERCTEPWERERLAAQRRACLDELERRDPRAFARWLATARAAGDPGRVFRRQQPQA